MIFGLSVPFCPLLYLASVLLGSMGVIFSQVSPVNQSSPSPYQTTPVIVLTIAAIVSLVAAIGKQIDDYRKRTIQNKIVLAKFEKVEKIQGLQTKAIHQNRRVVQATKNEVRQTKDEVQQARQKQEEIEKSVKGLELLRNIGMVLPPPETGSSQSILIVDDDPTWVTQLGRFFVKNLGAFNLLQALDVESALKQVEKAPDWIFLDVKVGDRSGLEIIAPAKSYNPKARIVIITGWNEPTQLEGAVLLGAEIWRKPLEAKELNRMLRMLWKDFGKAPPSSDQIPVFPDASMPSDLPGQTKVDATVG